jgi:hypothetical protein
MDPFVQAAMAGSNSDTTLESLLDHFLFPCVATIEECLGDQAFGALWSGYSLGGPRL